MKGYRQLAAVTTVHCVSPVISRTRHRRRHGNTPCSRTAGGAGRRHDSAPCVKESAGSPKHVRRPGDQSFRQYAPSTGGEGLGKSLERRQWQLSASELNNTRSCHHCRSPRDGQPPASGWRTLRWAARCSLEVHDARYDVWRPANINSPFSLSALTRLAHVRRNTARTTKPADSSRGGGDRPPIAARGSAGWARPVITSAIITVWRSRWYVPGASHPGRASIARNRQIIDH